MNSPESLPAADPYSDPHLAPGSSAAPEPGFDPAPAPEPESELECESDSECDSASPSDTPTSPPLHPLYRLLRLLEEERVHFTLGRYRDDSVLLTVTRVGERVEIDVFEDGHVEVSRFTGTEDAGGEDALMEMIAGWRAADPA